MFKLSTIPVSGIRMIGAAPLIASFTVLLMLAGSAAAAKPAARPNVVLIITDDQGYGDVGAHGNTMIRTPHLDRLHSQSVRLTDFHVDPTCAPTRAALMTGRYSSRTGVWHTIAGRSLMAHDEVTLADMLKQAGYRTAIFGKWHLGDNYPMRPQDRGFDEVLIHGGGGVGQTPDHWGNDYFDDTYFQNGKPVKSEGYCTDVFFDGAMSFIEANRDRPFFCYIATNAPHSPYNVDTRYAKPYAEQGVPSPMAEFYGMITNIDENVGRLRQRLRELRLAENTLLIFMTDNGTAAGVVRGKPRKGQWPGFDAEMRGRKGSEYDGGHRVPCFFHWPAGQLVGGRDVTNLTAHIDMLPTLADLCGLRLPNRDLDGRSLASLLLGQGAEWQPRTLFVHSQRVQEPIKWRKSAVMTSRWRLVNGEALYDMQVDPAQKKNVADQHPEVLSQLRAAYDQWWASLAPAHERDITIVVGHPDENPATLTAHDWHAADRDVPWNHGKIATQPDVNGWWLIDPARGGEYEVTLRSWPAEASDVSPLDAASARLVIGDLELRKPVPAEARSVTFRVELEPGPTRLQTYLDGNSGQARGAFFVTFRHLPTN